MANFRIKYFVHTLKLPEEMDLNSVGRRLSSSSYVRRKMYFDNGDGEREIDLRSKFEGVAIEDSILKGSVKFETTEEGTDLSGRFNVLVKTNESNFFIGKNPQDYLVIRSGAGLARSLTKIISGILYGEEMGHIFRVKLTDSQIFKFLDNNRHTLKSRINDAQLDGISTIALHGPNVQRSIEIELISKFLTEYQAIRVLLHKEEWIVWISKNTGALSCMTSHNQIEFVKFIQKKILPLTV